MGGNMAEIKKDDQNKEQKTGANTTAPTKKITLVEMIMIMMLVGLVFVFIFPFQQMKVDQEQEAIARQKFEVILPTFEVIVAAAEEYKKNDEFAAYPILLDELNLKDINTEFFRFDYTDEGPTIIAISTKEFREPEVKVKYNMATKSYTIEDADSKVVPTVKEDWLP
jgi:competence protein ComGC